MIREMQIKTTVRFHLTLVRLAIVKKCTNNKFWRGCGEKGSLLHCWWDCKLMQPLWKTVWSFLKKLKTELLYDLAVPFLGIYLDKTIIQIDTCTPVFIEALFTIAKTQKQTKCPLTDEWIKMWYTHTHTHTHTHTPHTGILLSHKKEWNNVIYSNRDRPRGYHINWNVRKRKTNTIWYHTCGI